MFDRYLKNKSRSEIGALEGWVSIVLNAIMFIGKLTFGLIANSISLIADAFHTLSDIATSVVVIIGFKVAQKPADREHPYGHGRAETVATLTIAILIAVVGLEFVKMGIEQLFSDDSVETSSLVISIVGITILIKEWMARFAKKLGDFINSDTLRAEAIHHRSDMLSSFLVIVALLGAYFHINWLDGVMAFGIAIMMLHSGYEIAKKSIDEILGRPATAETVAEIAAIAKSIDGVFNVHDIIVHRYGEQLFISLHIEMTESLSPAQMHSISEKAEKEISRKMHANVVTHSDPVSTEGDEVIAIQKIANPILSEHGLSLAIQDLRIVGQKKLEAILFEVPIPVDYSEITTLEKTLKNELNVVYPDCLVQIFFKKQITETCKGD